MQWYLDVLKKYAVFEGRARRQEYWMYVLFNVIAMVVLLIISAIIGSQILYYLYILGVLVPSIAVLVRRLHDTGKSGWMVLLGLIPIIGGIILLVFACIEGDRAPNAYGPDPKAPMGGGPYDQQYPPQYPQQYPPAY